ncbi:hypothetical protein VB776_21825 [Arcicella sp. DC2W]|uniref:Uncharacterized protein n=1 Tax=Arcicella gelida TaxID=2984195 RepID=A0ABU5SAV8_9BACT|nr:hypothetical protein [Arcicella sp. DC2W]MEA5405594.1 hypothetical protein [Arcicella sp. DC2W]
MYQFIYGKYDRSFDDYKILTLKNSNNDWIAREILSAINVHPVDLDTYKQFYHFRVNFPDTQEIFIGICTYIRDYNRDSENRYIDFLHIRGEFNEKEEKNLFKDLYFWKAPISFTKDTKLDIEIQSLMKPEDDHIYPIIDWLFENWLNKRKCFLLVKNDKDSFLIDELKLISLYDLAQNEPVLHTLFYVLSNLPPILSNKIIAQFGYDNEYSNVPQYAHLIVGFDRLLSTTTKNFQRPIESNIDFYEDENKRSINYKNITLWKYIIEELQNDQELLSYIRPKTLSDSIDAISKKASELAFKKIINTLLEDIGKSDFETHLADYNQHIKNNSSNMVEIILIKTYFNNNPLSNTKYYDKMYGFIKSEGIIIRIEDKFHDLLNELDVKTLSTFKPIADESVQFKEIYNSVMESKKSLPSSDNDKSEQIDIKDPNNSVMESNESLPSSDNDKSEQIDIKDPNNSVMESNESLPSSDNDKPEQIDIKDPNNSVMESKKSLPSSDNDKSEQIDIKDPNNSVMESKKSLPSSNDDKLDGIDFKEEKGLDGGYDEAKDKIQSNTDKSNVWNEILNFMSIPIISWKKRKYDKKRKKLIKKLKEEYNLLIADSRIINELEQFGISNEEINIFLIKELSNIKKYDTIKEKLESFLDKIDSTTQTEQASTDIKKQEIEFNMDSKKSLSIKLYTITNIILIILITFYLNKIIPIQNNINNDSNYLIKKRMFLNPLITKDFLMNYEIQELLKMDSISLDSIAYKIPNGLVSIEKNENTKNYNIYFNGKYIKIVVQGCTDINKQNYPNYIYSLTEKYIIYNNPLMIKDSLIIPIK